MIKEKIGFIGCGNMGSAILEGILSRKIARASQISIYDPAAGSIRKFQKERIHICKSNREVIKNSKIIILAIKPQELRVLATETAGFFRNKIVITILAGTPIAKVKSLLGSQNQMIRAMPNLGAKVGESMTAICGDASALGKAKIIFSGCGEVVTTKERLIDTVTAVSGSGPAYFFYLMEVLASFAKAQGFSEKQANLLAVQTALGSAWLAASADELPSELRARVTSKGGTTAAALSVLESRKVAQIVCLALTAAQKRARELSRT